MIGTVLLTAADPVVSDTNIMEKIMSAAESAVEFSGKCLNAMVSNPLYLFFLGAGLIGVGLALVKKLRRAAK